MEKLEKAKPRKRGKPAKGEDLIDEVAELVLAPVWVVAFARARSQGLENPHKHLLRHLVEIVVRHVHVPFCRDILDLCIVLVTGAYTAAASANVCMRTSP